MKALDVWHLTKDVEDKTWERVILRMNNNTVVSVVGGEFSCEITTNKSQSKRKGKLEKTAVQQPANLEKKLWRIEEE